MTPDEPPSPDDILPLRPVELQILVSLGQGERHGYGIIQDAEERGEGKAVPGLATLYRALRRMSREGLIEVCDGPDEDADHADHERRRYFRMTELGREVLETEAGRLRRLVQAVDEADLRRERGPA